MEYELGDLRGGRATRANVLFVIAQAGEWQTRAQVAAALGLKSTPMTIQILEMLVREGALVRARATSARFEP